VLLFYWKTEKNTSPAGKLSLTNPPSNIYNEDNDRGVVSLQGGPVNNLTFFVWPVLK
jgi:type IV secretory pathway protease TraF